MLHLFRMLLLAVHCLLASVLSLLLTLARPFHPDNSRLCARLYAWPALCLLGIRVEARLDSLPTPEQSCVIVANHQSNFDLFVLGRIVPERTVSIGKQSLKWIPFFGQAYWLAGNVLVDRGNPRSAKRALKITQQTLRQRTTSIWIFPEGTRSLGRGLQPFKKGAFQMAINAGVPIVPVCVSSYAGRLQLDRWRSGRVSIQALPAIPTQGMGSQDLSALMEECRAQMQACIQRLDRRLEANSG
ncbi:1-acylglycerol-3-phosphate O-acyltransferase [Pseudomonas sp. RIT-PI-AD]|uniref:lysophospholipid acyltransferase family protein n=1 Tax=Pseudomonas sp. RIT-PI-AD TaxID=3035294 RepID=UPI0021DA6E8C|nr:1-acylglycerol-3-phosphate O-acyltransferase [Pseudomonas sp. RIT-PI-AD]